MIKLRNYPVNAESSQYLDDSQRRARVHCVLAYLVFSPTRYTFIGTTPREKAWALWKPMATVASVDVDAAGGNSAGKQPEAKKAGSLTERGETDPRTTPPRSAR